MIPQRVKIMNLVECLFLLSYRSQQQVKQQLDQEMSCVFNASKIEICRQSWRAWELFTAKNLTANPVSFGLEEISRGASISVRGD